MAEVIGEEFSWNVFAILLRGHDPASGGARNPHVLQYTPVPPLRAPPADDLSLQIANTFLYREGLCAECSARIYYCISRLPSFRFPKGYTHAIPPSWPHQHQRQPDHTRHHDLGRTKHRSRSTRATGLRR